MTTLPIARSLMLGVALLAAGCGASRSTTGPLACGVVGAAKCGAACKADVDCGTGLYCAASSTCAANCVAGGTQCTSGFTCDATGRCSASSTDGGDDVGVCGASTSVSGKVYDRAKRNGLYNVAVYVPASPLQPLPRGISSAADACSCSALYASGAVVSTSTAEDGTFKLANVPSGSNVQLVIQIGKWRRSYHIDVTACQDNPQADKSLSFPTGVAVGDTDQSIPDIAVSTGSADTLECLMRRVGIDANEYVAGTSMNGHVHVFAGGTSVIGSSGSPEWPGMAGAPSSPTSLWASQAQLMPYDLVLLSCEGGETYNANPPALEAYLNAGGRVFASHYHYAWFSGPLSSGQSYTAPTDWRTNLATWTADGIGADSMIGGTINTTLNGSTAAFPKGIALQKWLMNVGALGQNGVKADELSIFQPRYDATVVAMNKPSQTWISSDAAASTSGASMYFSFDTPVNPPTPADGGAPTYCGRAVFSDLHVAGDPATMDGTTPPSGCSTAALSPQEKALEFMLFDLSSCVIPDTAPPSTGVPIL